ncbi:LOW QUALITY PROTEIN: hypothetical protein Cgig2_031575 [Carnegiea gigantea]|uniref:Uncharacterized protein n=1 Tax=Carnegiea gigantea TaxID=171969 RepID=A0A9Q1GMZ4_9CARY|nr:LOW QUALITY PROTEIN: hypothetical protein Cgig2_031575 [Carnegiea gigantea]
MALVPPSIDARRWVSLSLAIFHGTDVGLPFPHRPSQKTFRPFARALSWPWLNRLPSVMSFWNYPRPKGLGCCRNRGFGRRSRPSPNCIGVPSSRGSGYLATGSMKLDSTQRAVWERMQEPVVRSRARVAERWMRMRPLRKRPPLRSTSSRRRTFLGVSLAFRSPNFSPINTSSFSHIGYSSISLSKVVANIGRAISVSIFFISMAFPPIHNMREMPNYVRETFIWGALCSPRLLPEDFHVLCPRFSLAEAGGVTAEFEILEIVQATFYAMLLNEAFALGMAQEYTAESMKSRWKA